MAATTRKKLWALFRATAWAPLAVLVFHSGAAAVFGHEPYVDPISHFLGGVAISYFLFHAVVALVPGVGAAPRVVAILMAFGLAVTTAVTWELGELGSDLVLGTNIQHDARNVLRDLALGTGGALFMLGLHSVGASRAK